MKKVEALLAAAYRKAKTTSEGNIEVLEKQADAKGTSNEAYALRARIKGYLAGDQAALTTIAKVAPDLVARWAPVVPEASVNRFVNFGGLAKSLTQEGEDARTAPPLSSDGGDKTLADLKDRCKDAAQRVEAKRAAAKPGSDEARYLADLKAVLTQGATNPTDAIRGVRMLSGFELSAVLAQLGVPPSTKH